MADRNDILSQNGKRLTDEELLKYLCDDQTGEKKKLSEKELTDSFESDAIAGLQQIKDEAEIRRHVRQLHQKLPHLLLHNKHRKEKKRVGEFQWTIVAILILLFLCIITYMIFRMNGH